MTRPQTSDELGAMYALLGVSPSADDVELRRAYRELALRHHPDVAGESSTALFQRIAAAYRTLSNSDRRAAYDINRGAAPTPHAPRSARARDTLDDLITRASGALNELIARGIARRPAAFVVELHLTAAEGDAGGTAALDLALRVPCPTCGGLAEAGSLWCATCHHDGTIFEPLTVCVPVPPLVADGAWFSIAYDRSAVMPPLRVCIRVTRPRPAW